MRELSVQLALLNHQVSARLQIKDTDFDCLDLINRYGPLSPTALARQAGLHAATMTGILDRLERGGWIVRERDPVDRRAVNVRALRERNSEVYGLYSGMNGALDELLADYEPAELDLIAEFLRRTADAGRTATEKLATDPRAGS
jgi:DNA-binding MarR family transcriptional regulator